MNLGQTDSRIGSVHHGWEVSTTQHIDGFQNMLGLIEMNVLYCA